MKDWTPEEMIRLSSSYWEVCALHAAVEIDVFTPLRKGPLAVSELASRLGCPERGLAMLLTVLCVLHLLERADDSFCLTPFAETYLCQDSDAYIGHIIRHHSQLMPGWARLAEAVRQNHPTRQRISFTEDSERKNFLMGMYNMASVRAEAAVKAIDLRSSSTLLDLGGGPGAYAVRFCAANPALSAVIFDLPTSRPFAESIIRQNGMEGRIRFTGGDFFTDPLPEGFDAVWLSHILHSMNNEEAERLLARAVQAAVPGGMVMVQDFILRDDQTGPLFPSLFALNMLTGTKTGKAYTWQEIERLLEKAGARRIRRVALPTEDGSGIVIGEKA